MRKAEMQLNTLLGLRHSLIQAPMAGVQDSSLAVAVSAAGGLGSLPAAMLDAQSLRRELQVLQASGLPYNVNFFCHQAPAHTSDAELKWQAALQPYYQEFAIDPSTIPAAAGRRPFDEEMAEILEEFSPRVVSFHFGLPNQPLLARVKARGSFVASSATTLNEAQWLVAHGVDAVIAQGLEAGGHRGHFLDRDVTMQSSLLPLLQQLTAHIHVPIIAAGGIADAHGVHAAMAAGEAFLHPLRWADVRAADYAALHFPGGHAPGMRPYCESAEVARLAREENENWVLAGLTWLRPGDRRALHVRETVEAEALPVRVMVKLLRDRIEAYLPPGALTATKVAEESERQGLRIWAGIMETEVDEGEE